MNKIILITLVIYLLGCFCSYQLGKYKKIEISKSIGRTVLYSTSDRAFNLAISTFSWISAAAWGLFILTEQGNDQTPAKW